jgi:4-hydroxy-tetrahydrodipicolinate synthase
MKMICPIITAFREDGLLDIVANKTHIENVIAGGVDGILALGSIGEFYAMTLAERMEFAAFVVETVGGRVPVWIGVGDCALQNVDVLMRHSYTIGADAVIALSPYYMISDQECLYQFYADIAQAAQLPLYLYNFPDRTGINLAPETLVRLAREFPQIVGIKDTVDTMSHTRALIQAVQPFRADFDVYSGFDEYAIPNLLAGGSGAICGLNNLIPATFQQLLRGFQTRDMAAVTMAQAAINRLMPLYTCTTPFVQAIKYAVSLQTPAVSSIMRHPTAPLSAQAAAAIQALCCGLPH